MRIMHEAYNGYITTYTERTHTDMKYLLDP
jgi:hypothetical protein